MNMKKLLCLLLIICLLPLTALANEIDTVEKAVDAAKNLLTEVYGYTRAEADAFSFRVREDKDRWHIMFSPRDAADDDVYYATFFKETGELIYGNTPFRANSEGGSYYPGEAAIREVLNTAKSAGWFANWDEDAKKQFMAEVTRNVERLRGDLLLIDTEEGYSAARAINGFFLSCYGDRATWSELLVSWRNDVLAENGFTTADCMPLLDAEKGVRARNEPFGTTVYECTVTEFVGELPKEMENVLNHPKLKGYEVLSGALVTCPQITSSFFNNGGLVAFGKGEERMLVLVWQPKGESEFLVYPVGEKALLSGREVVITYPSGGHDFMLTYPISSTALERFSVCPRFTGYAESRQPMCVFEGYERVDYANESGVLIKKEGNSDGWCTWTEYSANGAENASFVISPCAFMEYLDVAALPKTAKECAAVKYRNEIALPDGFTAISGVHMRKETSSHSEDMGDFRPGTVVRVLDTVPGDPFPWLHIQVGEMTGYMSGQYAQEQDVAPLYSSSPLSVARVDTACALKMGASNGSETVMEMKAGYKMHVLATLGDWYYVCIPSGEPGWMMDINGAYGFVKQSNVTVAATALHLDWQE